MKLYTIALIAATLFPFLNRAQYTVEDVQEMVANAPEEQLVVEASRMLQEDYYYFSEIVVDKLLTIKPESANYNYRKGFIVLGSHQDYIRALPFLEKAVTKIDNNYDMYSAKEESAPTDAYYHMGRCYHLNEELDKAVEYYNKFIESSRKKSELIHLAELGIIQCGVARENISHPKSAVVKNIGPDINTEFPEYSPVISLDGQSLYFTSRRTWENNATEDYRDPKFYQYPEDIYLSYVKEDGGWTKPRRLDFCNGQNNEATIAISTDERRIYAYQDVTGMGDIYYSEFAENKFSILEQLNTQGVNTKFWETHCTVTPDGNNMYFVSERPGGFGGRDIYRLVKMPDGSWSEPQNLGPNINTPYDEESPFLMVDNKTMYFASNGPGSMGGFDIFVTVRDDNNEWSTPINLGYPINKTGDDLFYTTTIDGLKGYLSSFRPEGHGEKDIYEIQNDYMGVKNVIVLKGALKTIDGTPLAEDANIRVKCTSCPDNIELLPRLRDGAFITPLQACKEYEIIFMKNATEEVRREKFTTSCNMEYQEIYKEAFIGGYALTGTVKDKLTGLVLSGATIQFVNPTDGSIIETLTTDDSGTFTSGMLAKKEFGAEVAFDVKVNRSNYLNAGESVALKLENNPVIRLEYSLDRVDIGTDIGTIVKIQPIYFDLNKYDIRPDAQVELDKIVKIMNENPGIEIELGSHTDCRGSQSYNLKLSDRRAKASAEYIRARISNPGRINGKGYGESKLINDCGCEGKVQSDCSDEEHQANRRTEFRIIKM